MNATVPRPTCARAKQRYRSLFENMLDGYAYCHMLYEDGAPADFVYLDVNSAFERLTGLEGAVGHKVSEIIPGIRQDNPELFEIYGRVANSGQPESFETFLESLGIWFSVSVYSPQAQHFVAIFENITERKRAEEERRELLEESQAQAEELQGIYETQRDIALALQENFVHPLPAIAGLELAALSLPAGRGELIGGDFHDVLARPDGMVVALIGDVTGKGIEAAGFTETVRAAVRTLALISPSPEYILGNVNRLLLHEGEHQQLVTALLVVLDPRSGRGVQASAGHSPAVHVSDSGCRIVEPVHGLPLGVLERGYESTDFALAAGEALVLYTDGVTEARRNGELFGEKRLLEVLGGCSRPRATAAHRASAGGGHRLRRRAQGRSPDPRPAPHAVVQAHWCATRCRHSLGGNRPSGRNSPDAGGTMSRSTDEEAASVLANVIAGRRSVRGFSEAMPARNDLERIIAAGRAAPYAAAMSPGGALDRRFFVFSPASAALSAAARAIQDHAQRALAAPETPARCALALSRSPRDVSSVSAPPPTTSWSPNVRVWLPPSHWPTPWRTCGSWPRPWGLACTWSR